MCVTEGLFCLETVHDKDECGTTIAYCMENICLSEKKSS